MALRLVGAIVLAAVGWQVGSTALPNVTAGEQLRAQIAFLACGFGLGLLLTPFVTTRPYHRVRELAHRAPTADLVAAIIGLLLGLVFAALLSFPLSAMPWYFGRFLPIVMAAVLAYLGATVMVARKPDLLGIVAGRWNPSGKAPATAQGDQILVDTSAIIDGRIADITQTGFISGTLIVPRFVLKELQHIADSPDALRRNRGRRGLDILNKLKKDSLVALKVLDSDADGVLDVDGKLVEVAKQLHCAIITNDFNLNRVAALQGIRVLNINELANALKSVVLPGEEMTVRIIQEGKEIGQGVGYLDDGTMVVVEGGRRHLNSEITIIVSRVLQTAAGRMIFAHPRGDHAS